MSLVMDYVHITTLELSKGGKMFLNFQFNQVLVLEPKRFSDFWIIKDVLIFGTFGLKR